MPSLGRRKRLFSPGISLLPPFCLSALEEPWLNLSAQLQQGSQTKGFTLITLKIVSVTFFRGGIELIEA